MKNNTILKFLSVCNFDFINLSSGNDVGDPLEIEQVIEGIAPMILEYVRPISAILVFIAIMVIGLNIIIKRNKPDERSGLMMGLMTIAIGVLIIGAVGLIYSFIMSIAG